MVSVFYAVGLFVGAIAAFFIYRAEQLNVVVGDVANVQLMHIQGGMLDAGIGAAIIAAIFLSTGAIIQTLKDRA
jgi:hypothetical protein